MPNEPLSTFVSFQKPKIFKEVVRPLRDAKNGIAPVNNSITNPGVYIYSSLVSVIQVK
jgi:hypothetical protein